MNLRCFDISPRVLRWARGLMSHAWSVILSLGVSLTLTGSISGCDSSKRPSTVLESVATNPAVALAARGKVVYQTQCIACHNSDPRKQGALGPDVFGSSKELLEARILRREYPAGYTPKRPTHLMAPMPYLKNDIDAIHSYLNH